MEYMLLVYMDEQAWAKLSDAEQQRAMEECGPHVQDLIARGKILGGAPLHPTSTAATVRVRDGKRLVTDGPFAETREQLGGYSLIDAKDLDEAIDIAGRLVGTGTWSTIEVRPVVQLKRVPSA